MMLYNNKLRDPVSMWENNGNRTSKDKNSVYCSLPSQRIIPSSSSLGVSLMILLDFEIGFPDVSAQYSSGMIPFVLL